MFSQTQTFPIKLFVTAMGSIGVAWLPQPAVRSREIRSREDIKIVVTRLVRMEFSLEFVIANGKIAGPAQSWQG